MAEQVLGLTGNDIARSCCGIIHMLNWWNEQPDSNLKAKSVAEAEALLAKLDALLGHAYPYAEHQQVPADVGCDEILSINAMVVMRTQEAARRTQAEYLS